MTQLELNVFGILKFLIFFGIFDFFFKQKNKNKYFKLFSRKYQQSPTTAPKI